MLAFSELKNGLSSKVFDSKLKKLYGAGKALEAQKARYMRVLLAFAELFGEGGNISFCSAPGRTEVGGNHTDHNRGKVLAAAVNLDAIAAAKVTGKEIIRLKSENYSMDTVDITDLEPHTNEFSSSKGLIRGVCAGFVKRGYIIGGFDAATANDVISGSGLSSSAAFEVLVGTILNHLFNGGKISAVEIAQIAQYAENEYFGKPCGLMDQMACSVGGFVNIDFFEPRRPIINPVDFDFAACGHSLCIVNTGGSHSDLTDEYAAIKNEMISVAQSLGHEALRDADEAQFYNSIDLIRGVVGDRAVLRAMHFFEENKRVDKEVEALENGNFGEFKELVLSSGNSSYKYNQNVFSVSNSKEQPCSLGLALCERLLSGSGAWRIHGGGFAGTIQAFVPNELLDEFTRTMEIVFGKGSCYKLSVRAAGGSLVI